MKFSTFAAVTSRAGAWWKSRPTAVFKCADVRDTEREKHDPQFGFADHGRPQNTVEKHAFAPNISCEGRSRGFVFDRSAQTLRPMLRLWRTCYLRGTVGKTSAS